MFGIIQLKIIKSRYSISFLLCLLLWTIEICCPKTAAAETKKIVVSQAPHQNVEEQRNSDIRSKLTAKKLAASLKSIEKYEVILLPQSCADKNCLRLLATQNQANQAMTVSVVEDFGDFSFTLITLQKEYKRQNLMSYTILFEELEQLIVDEFGTTPKNKQKTETPAKPINKQPVLQQPQKHQQRHDPMYIKKKLRQLKIGLSISLAVTGGLLVSTLLCDIATARRIEQIDAGGKDVAYLNDTKSIQNATRIFGIGTLIGLGVSTVLLVKYKRKKKSLSISSFHLSPVVSLSVNGFALQGEF